MNTTLSTEMDNPIMETENLLYRTLLISAVLGVVIIIGYSFFFARGTAILVLFVSLLLALSTFIVGFFIGTLFGMPKRNVVNDSDYTLNNSLVEIADWLTKTIVGLGLISLKQIPEYLMKLGDFFKRSAGIETGMFNVFVICIVVYFTILGLYIGYNYMRLVLSQKYKQADENMLQKEIRKLNEEVQQKDKENKVIINEANRNIGEQVEPEKLTLNNETLTDQAKEKMSRGESINADDPQKGQWGGLAESNGRKLQAEVREFIKGLYNLTIQVVSTDESRPLQEGDTVMFALHPSFGEPPFKFTKVSGGTAEIKLISYGSFTIGAFADDGKTELELDLAELPNVSEHFKNT